MINFKRMIHEKMQKKKKKESKIYLTTFKLNNMIHEISGHTLSWIISYHSLDKKVLLSQKIVGFLINYINERKGEWFSYLCVYV